MIAGSLARLLARDGYKVLAIDADPAMNLYRQLGIDSKIIEGVKPVLEDSKLVDERVNIGSGLFILTPRVDDVIGRYGVEGRDNVVLVRLGTIRYGGSGCMCPANALLRAILSYILLSRDEAVVVDLEAGLEPLGRGTVEAVDLLISITEPTPQSIDTCRRVAKLASDLGLKSIGYVANKVSDEKDIEYIESSLESSILAAIPFDRSVTEAEKLGIPLLDYAPNSTVVKALIELKDKVKDLCRR